MIPQEPPSKDQQAELPSKDHHVSDEDQKQASNQDIQQLLDYAQQSIENYEFIDANSKIQQALKLDSQNEQALVLME